MHYELCIKKTLFIILACFLLSGCSSASVEELLSPPRLGGEQTEIYQALRNFTNSDIILKYPRRGQYRSAFLVKDIDDEPTDEAVVFYEMPNISTGSSLRMNFLDKQDGRWVSVYDFAASGSEVESVMLEDLGDSSPTIIVTYLVQNSTDRYTSLMSYKGGVPVEIANVRNIFMDIFDANGDGTNDMFTVITERTAVNTIAGIYGMKGGSFEQIGRVYLNSGFAGIRNVCCGVCDSDGTIATFIDYSLADGYFCTDAVIYSNETFYLSPALNASNVLRSSNSYTPNITCMDADGDGVYEIPGTSPFPGYDGLSRSEQVNLTTWYYFERRGTYLSRKFGSFVGTRGDYIFIFPENWGTSVTASVSIAEGLVRFNRYNIISDIPEENLLRLYSTQESNSPKYSGDEFIYLGTSTSSGYSYYAQLGSSIFTPSEEELKELFRIL